MHTDRLRKHVVDVLKLNRTLHLKVGSESSQTRLSGWKSLQCWNNRVVGWNLLPAGQVWDWKGSVGSPSTALQPPLQRSVTGTAAHFHGSGTVSAAIGSPKSSILIAQDKCGATMHLRELTVPLLLAKALTPVLHLLLSLPWRCSLGEQILTSWFASPHWYEHTLLYYCSEVSWVGLGGGQ